MFESQKITLIKTAKPRTGSINDKIRWFAGTLGLFGLRDKDSSCFRVFIELLKSSQAQSPLTSEQMASLLGLTRGTVIHHLNKLMEAGLVVNRRNRYMLRADSLSYLVEELNEDVQRILSDLKEVAADIDRVLGGTK